MNAQSQRSDPRSVSQFKLLKEPVLTDKAHPGKATEKKIVRINTSQKGNRMKVSAKLVFTSDLMDGLLGAESSTICRFKTLNMEVKTRQKFNQKLQQILEIYKG